MARFARDRCCGFSSHNSAGTHGVVSWKATLIGRSISICCDKAWNYMG
jgi:hypothetical protein